MFQRDVRDVLVRIAIPLLTLQVRRKRDIVLDAFQRLAVFFLGALDVLQDFTDTRPTRRVNLSDLAADCGFGGVHRRRIFARLHFFRNHFVFRHVTYLRWRAPGVPAFSLDYGRP